MFIKKLDKRFAVVNGKKITKKARVEATVLNSLTPISKDEICKILPAFLEESLAAMIEAWRKVDSGEKYLRWDCDYCNLQSDINSAEVNQMISTEQAWHLREKYLRIERV